MSSDKIPENLKQRLKESYDAIATKYNAWTIPNSQNRLKYLDKLLALIGETSRPPLSVLELGCGCGIPVTEKSLKHGNFHVTANDLSSAQIEASRQNLQQYGDRVSLIEGDMASLEFDKESFDVVLGFYSLIHLPRAEQGDMIQKIAGWLKPGGYFLANFSEEATEGVVYEKWLSEKGWVYWSGLGSEKTIAKIKEAQLGVIIGEISKDSVDSSFLWIIATKGDCS